MESASTAIERVRQLLGGGPARNIAPTGDIAVGELVGELLDGDLGFDSRTIPAINALCRKAALAPIIWDRYSSEWVKSEGAVPLDAKVHAGIAAVFLRFATLHTRTDPDVRGLALKCLNGIFMLLNDTRENARAIPLRDELRAAARALAASVR